MDHIPDDNTDETLESIALLFQQTSPPWPSTQLLAQVHTKSAALLQLQRTLKHFTDSRENLTSLVSGFQGAVEAAVATGRKGVPLQRAQDTFLAAYNLAIDSFEADWEAATRQIDHHLDSGSPISSTTVSDDPAEYAVPTSWLSSLDNESRVTIEQFLSLLLADPYTLGAGIATLEGDSLAYILPAPPGGSPPSPNRPSTTTAPPLQVLITLVLGALGEEAVLNLALGAWETAIREIVGRETSRKQDAGDLGASTSAGAREKELEAFLVVFLDVLDSMGICMGSGSTSTKPGPLSLHRGTEDILLKLLDEAKSIHTPLQSPTFDKVPSTTSPSMTFSPSSWGSTVTSSVTNTFSTLNAGLYTVATLGGSGLSTVANAGLGLFPGSPSLGAPSSPSLGSSTPSARSPSPSSQHPPSTPSRMSTSSQIWNPLTFAITRAATSLLMSFTPSSSSSLEQAPLIQRLISQLLISSFPITSEEGAGHRKVILLGIVRWWGFSWLGKKLAQSGAGGAYTSSSIPTGVRLSCGPEQPLVFEGYATPSATALLDEVYISSRDAAELMLGLHKAAYGAIVSAAGFSGSAGNGPDDWAGKPEDGEREKRALKIAAKTLVHAWGAGSRPSSKTASSSPPKPQTLTERSASTKSAVSLSPSEVVTLSSSFRQLVLRSPASGPMLSPGLGSTASSPPPTFKRSSAFNSSSSTPFSFLTPQKPSSTIGATLEERLEVVVDQLDPSAPAPPAVVFVTCPPFGGAPTVSWKMNSLSAKQRSPNCSPDNPPRSPLSFSFHRRARSPSTSPPTVRRGWTSPPRSPRHEALESGFTSSGSYFSTAAPSATSHSQAGAPSVAEQSTASSIWRRPSKKDRDATPATSARPMVVTTTPAELKSVRKAILSLVQQGAISTTTCTDLPGPDVFLHRQRKSSSSTTKSQGFLETLERAIQRSSSEHNWIAVSTYTQAMDIARRVRQAQGSTDDQSLLSRAASSMRARLQHAQVLANVARDNLTAIERRRRQLVDLARAERGAVDDLRIRGWYIATMASELGDQLRARLMEATAPRKPSESEEARKKVREWTNELGIVSFTKTETSFEESLMFIELASTTIAMDPSSFYSSPFWAKESAVMSTLMGHAQTKSATSFAESLLASGTTILTAPFSLAGLSTRGTGTSPNPSGPQLSLPNHVVLSFGASTPALLRPHEATTAFVRALEEHLLRVTLKTCGYMFSEFSSSTIANRDADGRPIGCDAWIQHLSSALSPLARPSAEEVRNGASPLPKAFRVSSEPVSRSIKDLLNRFTRHPSPHAKVLALFELELVLAASAKGSGPVDNSTSDSPSPPLDSHSQPVRSNSLTAKISNLIAKRLSHGPSPIAALLEGESEEDGVPAVGTGTADQKDDEDHSSLFSTKDSIHSSRRGRELSVASDSTLGDLAAHSGDLPDGEATTTTTDDLLLEIESIIRRVRPPLLFQNLQIVASLVPSAILDSTSAGKAFWDVALAAFSVKKDLVEGEFGVVERGLAALGEGTNEARELAERLLVIGAREESEVALQMLTSLGISGPV
ncbi:hypothetical protein T439DRAFT_322582 [Meredithblackwellia eburnea MCA 4105]